MSGSGGEVVGKVLMTVAEARIGRFVLWVIVALLGFMALVTGEFTKGFRSELVAVTFVLALFPLIGTIKARRKRSPSPIRWLLPQVAFAVVGMGIVGFLLWLKGRGQKAEALPAPPSAEEVDQLARLELEVERAA
jgi:predicted permease